MSDLLCAPYRPGWQVGISERRNLCRPGGAVCLMHAAWRGGEAALRPEIGRRGRAMLV